MKKTLILAAGAALCIVTFCGTFSGYVSGARLKQGTKVPIEAKTSGEKSAVPLAPKMSNEYIVGEKNGKIVLFRKTTDGTPLVWEEYDSDISANNRRFHKLKKAFPNKKRRGCGKSHNPFEHYYSVFSQMNLPSTKTTTVEIIISGIIYVPLYVSEYASTD